MAPASGPQWNLIKTTILETLRPEQGLVVAPYMLGQVATSKTRLIELPAPGIVIFASWGCVCETLDLLLPVVDNSLVPLLQMLLLVTPCSTAGSACSLAPPLFHDSSTTGGKRYLPGPSPAT